MSACARLRLLALRESESFAARLFHVRVQHMKQTLSTFIMAFAMAVSFAMRARVALSSLLYLSTTCGGASFPLAPIFFCFFPMLPLQC